MKAGLEERIAQARQRFCSRARLTADLLTELLCRPDAAPSTEALEDLLERVHQLAGSSGSFGFPTVGTAALALEAELEATPARTPAAVAAAMALVEAIERLDAEVAA